MPLGWGFANSGKVPSSWRQLVAGRTHDSTPAHLHSHAEHPVVCPAPGIWQERCGSKLSPAWEVWAPGMSLPVG